MPQHFCRDGKKTFPDYSPKYSSIFDFSGVFEIEKNVEKWSLLRSHLVKEQTI